MSNEFHDALSDFPWEPQPAAAEFVGRIIAQFRKVNPEIERLATRLSNVTGTRLLDWADTLVIPRENDFGIQLSEAHTVGFRSLETTATVWHHPEGLFPRIVFDHPEFAGKHALMFRVEDVDDFCQLYPVRPARIDGFPGSSYRTLQLAEIQRVALVAVERHGWRGFERPVESPSKIAASLELKLAFLNRERHFENPADGFARARVLIQQAVNQVGLNRACDLFFAAERSYWMARNRAARVQHRLQQQLGLGWANHDHHTYRSSRMHFHRLIEMLELLGFFCRERFYAGEESGWGAQVLEQPETGIVVFADVDMSAEEITGDFAHQGLSQRNELGTVGLWCQLHGESFLEAGMHHLECQFDFDAARQRLAEQGIETMAPFTDFPFLKQAFTKGEVWQVDPDRIEAARSAGQLSDHEAEQFKTHGAIGSHLEILERNDGYKGFNQTGVSDIIARTDPRKW